jgi:hypothetical protein
MFHKPSHFGAFHCAGFRVHVKGDVAIASDPFKVPSGKAGEEDIIGGGEAAPATDNASGTTRIIEYDDQP